MRWLLNLAYMTIGRYPREVPPAYLIPPAAFVSSEDVGRFRDVAPQAGLNVVATAGGVIVDDFAGTGRFDVVTSNFDSCGPMHYFRNNGDGTFTERTSAAGLDGQLGGLNMIQADYNNDGCKDILVLRGGWELPQRKSLLRNNCDGTFTDVTAASGLAEPATSSQTAVWADINNDGLLDLFVGNEDQSSQLFLNKAGTTFVDISRSAGVDRVGFTKGVSAADYDNDGFMDLYVSNFKGNNLLYRNNHDNTFTERARAAGVSGPGYGFATWFFDYDNDGWADLFATSYITSVDESVRAYLGLAPNASRLKLYKNLGDGSFRDVTTEVGLDKVFMPMGANFGDIDNDGFLDIHLGTGNPSYASLVPNVLLRNKEGKSFVDITASSGTGELHKGHGVAFADLDNDGDEEIVAEIGGATPGDSHPLRLFENPGHGNDWISLRLVGVTTNRAAIGARIKLTVENEGRQNPLDPSLRREWWILWRFPAGATHRSGQVGADRRARDLVARQQHAPAPNGPRHESSCRDHRTGAKLHPDRTAADHIGANEEDSMSATCRAGCLFAALLLLTVPSAVAAEEYPVTGMVLKVDRSSNTFTASIQAIPGFMPAMAMPFEVRHAKDLDGLVPGAAVEFALIVNSDSSYAERIRIVRYQSAEQDPLVASRLKLLTQIAGAARGKEFGIGDAVPDFRLTNQKGRTGSALGPARESRRHQLHLHELPVAEFLPADRQ